MKHIVLEQTKTALVGIINSITLETLDTHLQTVEQYFNFLKTLNSLPSVDAPKEEPTPVVASAPVEVVVERTEDKLPPNVYVFERKLRGGTLPELDGTYFVPEKLVRDMGLQHGDKVKVTDSTKYGEMTRYKFELYEKGDGVDPVGRVQLSYCIVESVGFGLGVSQHAGGDIKMDEAPFTFMINTKDSLDFNVRQGDVIDIAYYENNLESVRVLYKHDTKELGGSSTSAKKAPVKKTVEPTAQVDLESKFPINLSLLKGKTVLIVGSMYERAKFQKAFESLGVKLTHMTGDENKLTIRAAVRKSDIVVVTTMHVGHNGSIPTASYCKEFDKPLASVDRNGVQYILIEAERVYKRKLEQSITA